MRSPAGIAIAIWMLLAATTTSTARRPFRHRRHTNHEAPYCGESANIQGEVEESRESNNTTRLHTMELTMALDSTACIKLQNVIHVLRYERLEQNYPIESSYTFGIPELSTACKCDCGSGVEVCTVKDFGDDRNCTSTDEFPTCFTKYHSDVANTECAITSLPAKACCDIKVKPYKGTTYVAVKLQQPISQIIISHTIYANSSGRLSKMFGPEEHTVILNKGREQLELNERNRILLTMRAGPPLQQLPHGMYYFPEGTEDLREAKINEANEAYLEKLGWYKKVNNQWSVNRNGLPLRNAYKVVMTSCKGQLHQDQFIGASNYVLRGKEYFDDFAERRVVDYSYVKKVKVSTREVKVIHQYGTAASMYVKTDTLPNLTKTRSLLANFTGIISLDHSGNRMFNATFYGARGTVHITLFDNERKNYANFACTTQFGNAIQDTRSRISLPSNVNREQFVCVLADEQPRDREICKWIAYEEHSMKRYTDESRWSAGHSPCSPSECNNLDRTASETLTWILDFTYINDLANVKGLDNMVKIGIHVCICAGLVFIFVILLTKCVVPLACFTFTIPMKKKKKSSKG